MSLVQCVQVFIELTAILLAFGMGIYALKYMGLFFRIIVVQLLLWILCYALSYALTTYQKLHGIPQNNQWLMNIHMIAEALLLFAAAFVYFVHKAAKIFVLISALVFLGIAFGQLFLKGTGIYLNYADVAECILMTALFSGILYSASNNRKEHSRLSVILLSSGLIVYFACSIPLISLLHIILERDSKMAGFLFQFVNDVLANIRYLLTALAFYMLRRKAIHLK